MLHPPRTSSIKNRLPDTFSSAVHAEASRARRRIRAPVLWRSFAALLSPAAEPPDPLPADRGRRHLGHPAAGSFLRLVAPGLSRGPFAGAASTALARCRVPPGPRPGGSDLRSATAFLVGETRPGFLGVDYASLSVT